MNKWQKQVAASQLQDEEKVLKKLRAQYKKAITDINAKIRALQADELTQSKIYQLQYQKALKSQINGIIDRMNDEQYTTIEEYLKDCYESGYIGAMYDIQKQGIPIMMPIDQDQVVKALVNDVPLSEPMYTHMGKSMKVLKNRVNAEISRGISQALSYAEISRNVENKAKVGLSNAYRIARTEGHRIQNQSAFDAITKARDAGADIVKQWDSTMDGRARPDHRKLDGQIREIDEPFEVNGHKAMYPSGFGIAKEDINCRCAMLQRAKWGLDEDELETLKQKAQYFGLDKSKDFDDFRKKYIEAPAKTKAEIAKLTNDLSGKETDLKDLGESKTYSGIWKDDVKVSDYTLKKNSIQAKKNYFESNILTLKDQTKIDEFKKHLAELDEFETLGQKYESLQDEIKDIKAKIDALTPKKARAKTGAGGAFSQERKDAALWFDRAHGGFAEADKYFDPPAQKLHSSASSFERNGFYTYTPGSGGHNRPLAGFKKPWNKWGSGWEDEYYVGAKNVWIDYEDKGDQIRGLTELIQKSTYDKDVWLQSGQNFQTIEAFLNIPKGTLQNMDDDELQQFVGRSNVIYNFLSTAVNEGGGSIFNQKPLKINFYAPKGSQMLYASDAGAFGKGENEMILQRGGSYTITKMYWGEDATDGNRRKIFVDIEIHPEQGYDLFQQDPNEWKGSRETYRG